MATTPFDQQLEPGYGYSYPTLTRQLRERVCVRRANRADRRRDVRPRSSNTPAGDDCCGPWFPGRHRLGLLNIGRLSRSTESAVPQDSQRPKARFYVRFSSGAVGNC